MSARKSPGLRFKYSKRSQKNIYDTRRSNAKSRRGGMGSHGWELAFTRLKSALSSRLCPMTNSSVENFILPVWANDDSQRKFLSLRTLRSYHALKWWKSTSGAAFRASTRVETRIRPSMTHWRAFEFKCKYPVVSFTLSAAWRGTSHRVKTTPGAFFPPSGSFPSYLFWGSSFLQANFA